MTFFVFLTVAQVITRLPDLCLRTYRGLSEGTKLRKFVAAALIG
jgi:hypothetical protein